VRRRSATSIEILPKSGSCGPGGHPNQLQHANCELAANPPGEREPAKCRAKRRRERHRKQCPPGHTRVFNSACKGLSGKRARLERLRTAGHRRVSASLRVPCRPPPEEWMLRPHSQSDRRGTGVGTPAVRRASGTPCLGRLSAKSGRSPLGKTNATGGDRRVREHRPHLHRTRVAVRCGRTVRWAQRLSVVAASPQMGRSDRGASPKCRALGHIKGWRLLPVFVGLFAGASLCGAAPLTAKGRRGALSDSPLPTGLGPLNQSLCEHWCSWGCSASCSAWPSF
jgi:hypothetical protein